MKKVAVIISPNWKEYAERYLEDCLASLRTQSYRDFKLYLVDNETSEKSLAYLKARAPEAEIIALEKNEGFAGGNNAALRRAVAEQYEYAFLINMDALVEKDCLEKLVVYADLHKDIAALQPRIMLWPDREHINSLGNETHFLGFGFCSAYRQNYDQTRDAMIKEVSYASGAGVLYRLEALQKVGLYDEVFWMYNEDQDIGLRLKLAGWKNIVLPEALMYHKYEFSRSISKYYWMDRNRIILLLKNCRLATLLMILPAFVIMEIGHIFFSVKSGWFKDKLRVWKFFLSAKNWSYLRAARSSVQAHRVISDRELTKLFTGRIWYQEIDDIKLRLVNPFLAIYWKIVRVFMFW